MKIASVMKFLSLIILILIGFAGLTQPQQKNEDITVDGMKRSFITYLPSARANYRMPLVISLHGGYSSPKEQFRIADFRPVAEREKFIVVCPKSKNIWHDGRDTKGIDDVKFIDSLITYIINTYQADPKRVYITGISNGGFLASRLACELSQRIAAIAVVAGTMNIGEGYIPVKAMPVIYMQGTKDPIFSNKGGKKFGRRIYSQDSVLKVWAELAKCNTRPVITSLPDSANDGTNIIKKEYINSVTGIKVIGYSIVNGGHTWPGGYQYLPKFIIGKTTQNLNACTEIWNFFQAYKLK